MTTEAVKRSRRAGHTQADKFLRMIVAAKRDPACAFPEMWLQWSSQRRRLDDVPVCKGGVTDGWCAVHSPLRDAFQNEVVEHV